MIDERWGGGGRFVHARAFCVPSIDCCKVTALRELNLTEMTTWLCVADGVVRLCCRVCDNITCVADHCRRAILCRLLLSVGGVA